MAFNRISFLAIAIILLSSTAFATEYIVGDGSGWIKGFDYDAWAKDKMFMVGDTLVFQYTMPHNVYKVNGTEFQDCLIPPGVDPLTTGNDTIPLKAAGIKWYICGAPGHCLKGQKLKLTVMDSAPVPSPNAAARGTNILFGLQVLAALLVSLY